MENGLFGKEEATIGGYCWFVRKIQVHICQHMTA
jgi:hypothetical protein